MKQLIGNTKSFSKVNYIHNKNSKMVETRISFLDIVFESVPKFGNFQANLVEFRVQKGHFLVVTQRKVKSK